MSMRDRTNKTGIVSVKIASLGNSVNEVTVEKGTTIYDLLEDQGISAHPDDIKFNSKPVGLRHRINTDGTLLIVPKVDGGGFYQSAVSFFSLPKTQEEQEEELKLKKPSVKKVKKHLVSIDRMDNNFCSYSNDNFDKDFTGLNKYKKVRVLNVHEDYESIDNYNKLVRDCMKDTKTLYIFNGAVPEPKNSLGNIKTDDFLGVPLSGGQGDSSLPIELNKFYKEYEMVCCMRKNIIFIYSDVFHSTKNLDIIISMLVEVANGNVKPTTRPSISKTFTDILMEKKGMGVKKMDKSITKDMKQIKDLELMIEGLNNSISDKQKEQKQFKEKKEITKTELKQQYKNITKNPNVDGVTYLNNTLIIKTKDIFLKHDGRRYFIGNFTIKIRSDGTVRIANDREVHRSGRGWIQHPNVVKEHPCLGNIKNEVPRLIKNGDFDVVVDLIIEYLKSFTEDDNYIHLEDWDRYVQ